MSNDNRDHTPGPWRAVYFENHDCWDVDYQHEPDHNGPHGGPGSGRYSVLDNLTEADAYLIAAAPKLLAALEWAEETLRTICGADDPCVIQARAALTTARGKKE